MNLLPAALTINSLLMMVIPVIVAIIMVRRFKYGWRFVWIGAATFVISQVGHIPFNLLLTELFKRGILPSPPSEYALVFNAIVLGLSAGLWEEITRWSVYRWWAKDARSWRKAVLMGTGHGGIEAILLGLLALYTFVQLMALKQVDVVSILPPGQAELVQQQVEAYWATPLSHALLGALERSLTLVVHITLSVVVLQAVIRHQLRWLWLAIGLHTAVNAAAVYVFATWGAIPAEITIAIFAAICLGITFALRKPEPELDPVQASEKSKGDVKSISGIQIEPPQESDENLENTRYN